jgi:hypothetical protein
MELKNIIVKSLFRNHFIHYTHRLSLYISDNLENKNLFFKTYQKLICLYKLESKVPNKKFNFSRFFLNKKLHTLRITNVYK